MATATASRVEQIYLTYCGPGEGLRREPGFYDRAASTRDPEVSRFALDLAAYELPLGLLGANSAPPQASPDFNKDKKEWDPITFQISGEVPAVSKMLRG
jgi:hypothetical protein